MMIVRKLLDYIFTRSELLALDDALPGQEKTSEEKMEEFISMEKKPSHVPSVQISLSQG